MPVRPLFTSVIGSVALTLSALGLTAASASPAAADPCGFYRTSADAFYNHCTADGSRVVIKVDAAWADDYELCVGPGRSWLGSAGKIRGAHYAGRTC